MSRIYLFASNQELKEQPNPYVEFLSINEALRRGIPIDPHMNEHVEDPDEEGIVLLVENEDQMDYPNIFHSPLEKSLVDETDMKYFIEMQGDMENYAIIVLGYIKEHMKNAEEMELWSIILEEEKEVERLECSVEELDVETIQEFYRENGERVCLKVYK